MNKILDSAFYQITSHKKSYTSCVVKWGSKGGNSLTNQSICWFYGLLFINWQFLFGRVNEATLVKSEFVLQSTLGSESNSRKIPASSNIFVPFGKMGNFARFLPQDYKWPSFSIDMVWWRLGNNLSWSNQVTSCNTKKKVHMYIIRLPISWLLIQPDRCC